MSIDLHIHSTKSDGTLTPTEIVALASKKGLKAIAITDHDTFEGVEEAQEAGQKLGLEVISGIELSVRENNIHIHILGYLFDHHDTSFTQALKKVQQGRSERNSKIIARLGELGAEVSIEEVQRVSPTGQIGRPHIARVLVDKEYVDTIDEAFDIYLGAKGKAYISRYLFDIEDAIGLIKKAGGVSVLAHPYAAYKNCTDFSAFLDNLQSLGLGGIEAYYPPHSRKFRKELISMANQKSLFVTGGSDFHGDIRPGTTLAGGKNVTVPFELLNVMKGRVFRAGS